MNKSTPEQPTPAWSLRNALESDAAELARLTSQLGYPTTEAVIRERLRSILRSHNDRLLVAVLPDRRLAGWIHGFLSQLLESNYRVEIGGLVVDDQCRRHGIGRELVGQIEHWAREQGARELSVRCREERTESHRFYARLSFAHTKTQRVFRKPIL